MGVVGRMGWLTLQWITLFSMELLSMSMHCWNAKEYVQLDYYCRFWYYGMRRGNRTRSCLHFRYLIR